MATFTERQPHPVVNLAALRLPILDRYLLREMIGPFLFSFFAYLIFWALNIFVIAADYIINQHAPFFLVLRFVLFRVPQAIPMAFPFAALFAALLAMGRVMGDNEVTAMRTSGIPVWRIALTPLIFGFVMFVVCYEMNEHVAPAAVDISDAHVLSDHLSHRCAAGRAAVLPQGPRQRQRFLRQSGAARQQDDARRAGLQTRPLRRLRRNAAGQDRPSCKTRARAARRDRHALQQRRLHDKPATRQRDPDRASDGGNGERIHEHAKLRSVDDVEQGSLRASQRAETARASAARRSAACRSISRTNSHGRLLPSLA